MFFMRARFLSTAVFLAAVLFNFPSLAASRCDVDVPTERVDLEQVSLAYQSIGRASDPALLLVMGLGGQLIHWPDDAFGLMDALHVKQFHVLGASMGGMIAQHMAAMAPQRVESLTLLMTSSGAEGLA